MQHRNLPIVLFITFFDFLSISVFFGTTIPLILAKHSIFNIAADMHTRAMIYGLVLLILPVGQFLFAPLWGQLSDQYGRKVILFLTLLLSAAGYLLMGLAISADIFTIFVFGRIITALAAVNMSLGQASLADISKGKIKTQRFNLQFIAVSAGFIVGPYLISYTTHLQYYANPYWVISAGYVVAFVLIAFLFRETLPFPGEEKINWLLNVQRIFVIFKNKRLQKIFLMWIIFQLGWSLFFQYSGEFLYLKHHVTNNFINHLFSWVGVGVFLVQLLLVQPLSHKVMPQKIIPWAILIIGVSLFIMGFIKVGIGFYIFLALYCFGIGFFLTNMNTYVSNQAANNEQGRALATLASTQSLMDIAVTLAGSFFVSYYLPTPYVVGGIVILLSLLLWRFQKS